MLASARHAVWYACRMLRAVTLDFWNTLFVDREGHVRERRRAACLAAELERAGLHREPFQIEGALGAGWDYFEEVWHRESRTPSAAETLQAVLAALRAPLPPDAHERLVATFERLLLDVPPDPVPSASRVVRELSSSFRLAVISDTGYSPGWVLRELLERHGMLAPFAYLYFSNEQTVSKPDVRAFRTVLEALEVRASEAAHVGDMQRTDIAGAQAAGMWAVHFVGANNRDAAISTADAVIRHFDELPTALSNLRCASC
jgi:putative hydrolase of the HAD superfamily